MYYRSTIRPKMGECPMCTDSRKRPLIKGLCETHYWYQNKMKSAQKYEEKEISKEDGLPELIEEADIIFSRYVRLTAANSNGIIQCYICKSEVHYKQAHAMHFIPRGNMYLRYDLRNVRAGDELCNCVKGGNLILFAKRLNHEQPGLADILMEESRIIHKYSRDEVRQIINEYSIKVKELLKTTNA